MRWNIFSLLLISVVSGSAVAGNCTVGMPGDWRHGIIFEDAMLCGSSATNSDTWQEFHNSNGTLTEYAKGPGDPVDPTHDVGSWVKLVSGPAPWFQTRTVQYTYGTNVYTFDVYYNNDSDHDFREIVFCEGGAGTGVVATAVRIGFALEGCP